MNVVPCASQSDRLPLFEYTLTLFLDQEFLFHRRNITSSDIPLLVFAFLEDIKAPDPNRAFSNTQCPVVMPMVMQSITELGLIRI